ncbi:hypothetical protein J4436_03120 [Candidatus Woesearchaeota archaeon]|nr:hypothetical protein [Candidatus Woesearchaeota archaeon]
MNKQIQYTGLKNLNLDEQQKIKKLISNSYKKIQYLIKDIEKIDVLIKTYDITGKRKRYSITLKTELPSKKIFTTTVEDWILSTVCHKAVNDLKNEIEKNYKTEGKNWSYKLRKVFTS